VAATPGLAVVSLTWHLDPFTGRRVFQRVPLRPGQPGQTTAPPR
jgi:hypothetical protein